MHLPIKQRTSFIYMNRKIITDVNEETHYSLQQQLDCIVKHDTRLKHQLHTLDVGCFVLAGHRSLQTEAHYPSDCSSEN